MNYIEPRETLDRNGLPAAVLVERQLQGRKWPVHFDSVEPFAIVADIATITLSSVASGFLYHLQDTAGANDVSKSFGMAILVSALFVSLMKIRGMYRPIELLNLRHQVRASCLTWITAFLVLSGALFALKIGSEFSRGTSIVFAMLGLAALLVHRRMTAFLLTKGLAERRFSGRAIVLITDEAGKDSASLAQALTDTGFRVKRHFLLPEPGADLAHRQRIVASVIDFVRGSDVEEIVVGANPHPWSDLRTLGAELRVLPFPVSFVPLGTASDIFKRPQRELGSAVCVELQRGMLSPLEHGLKRIMDVVIASAALTALSPLLALVAIGIKLDSPGPVLFRQQRCGFNGRSFQIYKFRTMSVLEDGPTVVQAQAGDKRFTRLGAWLRRTSIDELPQLLNVLNGSMSLVGPRPHALAHDNEFDKLVRNYAFRRRVKPGLTGWAQVHGCRGPTPTRASIEERVEHDLWYIDNWSLSLDVAILLRTPIELIRGDNAY
ncbi:undecaprenyl-phosphate glucose phosphotransferase [Bradyrhizobium sp. HKCCYLS20291]|uniref:undecaprenyl-phosphate glucose phosphotransferase n=1 Tax=Bradyrhizobium sp. HKCCYLS20291 TaxID=3420766 RepID=UPI003EBF91E5